MAYGTYKSRDPRAAANPLRSMALFRPAAQVFGPSPLETAEATLRIVTGELAGHLGLYDKERLALSAANRRPRATWTIGMSTSPRWRTAAVAPLAT